MVNQIQKNAQDIEQRLAIIEQACLLKPCPPNKLGQLPSCKEFFTFIEVERAKDVELLARKYQAIGPLLTKVEGLVVHTNTGSSAKLQHYYGYWEQKIFSSLTKVSS